MKKDSGKLVGFRLFHFSRRVYPSGPGFWIPEAVKKKMTWTKDCKLAVIIFNDSGVRIYDGVLKTISGGEIYLPKHLTPGEKIHVILFRTRKTEHKSGSSQTLTHY